MSNFGTPTGREEDKAGDGAARKRRWKEGAAREKLKEELLRQFEAGQLKAVDVPGQPSPSNAGEIQKLLSDYKAEKARGKAQLRQIPTKEDSSEVSVSEDEKPAAKKATPAKPAAAKKVAKKKSSSEDSSDHDNEKEAAKKPTTANPKPTPKAEIAEKESLKPAAPKASAKTGANTSDEDSSNEGEVNPATKTEEKLSDEDSSDSEDEKAATKAAKPAAEAVTNNDCEDCSDDDPAPKKATKPAQAEPMDEDEPATVVKTNKNTTPDYSVKRRVCSYCLKTFKNTKNKQDHVEMMHENSSEKKVSCRFCNKLYMSQTSLNYHVDVSHSETHSKVQCKFCDATFQHDLSLQRHLNTMHENPKISKCFECNKTFKRADYLTVHQKLVHKKVNIEVGMAETLKLPDGSYKCKNCGAVKADERDVIKHLVENCKSAEKYLCPVCNKCSSSKSNLLRHMQNSHYDGPVNVLSCEECEFVTKHASSLLRHKKRKH